MGRGTTQGAGGFTAMLTTMACFGLILAAHMHRDERLNARGLF